MKLRVRLISLPYVVATMFLITSVRLPSWGSVQVECPSIADTSVFGGSPTTNYGDREENPIGPQDAEGEWHSYVKFDLSGVDPGSVIIERVVLQIYVTATHGDGYQRALLHQVAGAWEEMALTWRNRPAAGAHILHFPVSQTGPLEVPLATSVVEDWLESPSTYHGLVLMPMNPGGPRFDIGQREAGGSLVPRLVVTVTPTVFYSISGTISDNTSNPLEGVTVTADGHSATTGSDGI